jgi:hypothetical protein
MPRAPKVSWLRGRVGEHAARQAAVMSAYARRYRVMYGVDADGVRGLVRVCVVGDHLREVQGGGARDG